MALKICQDQEARWRRGLEAYKGHRTGYLEPVLGEVVDPGVDFLTLLRPAERYLCLLVGRYGIRGAARELGEDSMTVYRMLRSLPGMPD